LVDAEPGGFNLCPRDAARRRTPRTCAIVVAHLFGHPAPIEPFLALGVPVVEDCAQSIGASEGGRPCGGAGAVAIGSFYATKVITTGQGGLVASNDAELRARIRDWVEYDQREDWQPRWSCRMSELQAALGLWQLDRLAAMLIRRRELSDYYRDRMETGERPLRLTPRHAGEIAYRCIARVPDADAVLEWLNQRGVGARRPVHRPLHHYFPELAHGYPHAEAAHREVVSLPLYPALTDAEAELVMDTFLAIPQALLRSNPSDC
jgi:dTDP-4-amino-4,6-dideoxygalactose transaminase